MSLSFMEFSYSTVKDGEYTKDVLKKQVNLNQCLANQVNILISKCPAAHNIVNFAIKFEFPSIKKDIVEVYYMSQSHVYMTCSLVITWCPYNDNVCRINKEMHHVQAKQWLYMGTIMKQVLQGTMNDSCIIFEFKYQILAKNYIKSDNSYTPKVQLANDIENLLNNGFYSDVTIKSTEGIEFKVHKNILACRSAVLKANFEHNTTECYTNIIETSLEEDVLREVLLFIYSDKAPKIKEMPDKLLAAADYYQLEELKMLCVEPLLKRITIENAIETLQFADLHSADTLKQKTLEFIKNSPMSKIIKTEGWANIKSIELVKSICEYIARSDVGIFS